MLDKIAEGLTQDEDAMEDWNKWCRYNVTSLREVLARILLDLTLSVKTQDTVLRHEGCIAAVRYALGDEKRLTKKTKRFLNGVVIELDIKSESGLNKVQQRVQARRRPAQAWYARRKGALAREKERAGRCKR